MSDTTFNGASMRPPKTKKEMYEHAKEHDLTVGKLMEYLGHFPKDTPIYVYEEQVGSWLEVAGPTSLCCPAKEEKRKSRQSWNGWFKGNKQKVNRELAHEFQFVYGDNGLCFHP